MTFGFGTSEISLSFLILYYGNRGVVTLVVRATFQLHQLESEAGVAAPGAPFTEAGGTSSVPTGAFWTGRVAPRSSFFYGEAGLFK